MKFQYYYLNSLEVESVLFKANIWICREKIRSWTVEAYSKRWETTEYGVSKWIEYEVLKWIDIIILKFHHEETQVQICKGTTGYWKVTILHCESDFIVYNVGYE